MTKPSHVLKANESEGASFAFRHPLDPSFGCQMTPLSRLAGASSGAVNLVRVAPAECAFPLHRHHGEEEWMFVLEGTGEVTLDTDSFIVGPGDFAVFPAAGPAHSVRNTGPEDLVCLMGGDAPMSDVVDFPDLGIRAVKDDKGYAAAPLDAFLTIRPESPKEAPK